jgi:bifunctional oligoribonuclease and PAP phosphatase NrnA
MHQERERDPMSYRTPESRRADVQEVARALREARRVILTTHLNADGDGSGCEAALLSLIEEAGGEAWIVNPTPFPEPFRFLVHDQTRILHAGSGEAAERCRDADLCVVVDTGEKSRIGRVKPLVDHLPLVIVDHHPPGEDALAGVSLRDPSAAAAGELIHDLALELGGPWTRSVVEGIYVAILTDTGSFRFSNASPGAHRVIADLIERGASPDLLYRRVYGEVPIRRIQLLGATLPTLEVAGGGGTAWMTVPSARFDELGCTSEDLDGMVDYPREIEGVEVGLLFREIEPGQVKVSFRSNSTVDVNAIAREFGGGGHVRASGALLKGELREVRERVVARVIRAVAEEEALSGDSIAATGSGPGGEPVQSSGVLG